MHTIILQQRGVLTLPKQVRKALSLTEGQPLKLTTEAGRITIEPMNIIDQDLLNDIKQSLKEIKAGKFIEFSSVKELHGKLKGYED